MTIETMHWKRHLAENLRDSQPQKGRKNYIRKTSEKNEQQARTKAVSSLTSADVIVFVNNTQLDAADQLRLPKAPPYTKGWNTQRHCPTLPQSLCSILRLVMGAAVWMLLPQPSIQSSITRTCMPHKQRARPRTRLTSGLFSQYSLPLR